MKWYQRGLVLPAEIKAETGEYVASNDDIAAWVEECAELDQEAKESNQQLLASYTSWKENQGEKAGSMKPFLEKLLTRYPELVRQSFKDNGKTVRGVGGIILNTRSAFIDD